MSERILLLVTLVATVTLAATPAFAQCSKPVTCFDPNTDDGCDSSEPDCVACGSSNCIHSVACQWCAGVSLLSHVASPMARNSASQQPGDIRVGDAVSCPECEIATTFQFALEQGGAAPVLPGTPTAMLRDSRCNIVTAWGAVGSPIVYDPVGRFRRILDPKGEQHSGYESATVLVAGPERTVYVIDRRADRMDILGPDWTLVGSAPIPHNTFAAVRTSDDVLVLNANVPDAERFGHPYHAFDLRGNYGSSFGYSGGPVIPGETPTFARRLAAAAGGGFWAAVASGSYAIERWDRDGALVKTIRREASWFSSELPLGFTREQPAAPQILSILEDEKERLWVVVRVHDPNWREAVVWVGGESAQEVERLLIEDWRGAYDTVIEVIDTREGVLVASQRFDEAWLTVLGPGELVAFEPVSSGQFEITVHRFETLLLSDKAPCY